MKYRALTNIGYNGRTIAHGDIVDLMETEAAPLVADGLLEKINPEQPGAASLNEESTQ
jgi:hypothetical protein